MRQQPAPASQCQHGWVRQQRGPAGGGEVRAKQKVAVAVHQPHRPLLADVAQRLREAARQCSLRVVALQQVIAHPH
ncbi:MAG: hypothetical protein N3C59_10925, partial [Azovibrio sp.]|nr:hypothetical protein [Azovibrio sp.]